MSIAFGFHPLTVALAVIAAGVLTWWTYRYTTPAVSTGKRATLIALRWSALSLVLIVLAEPVIRTILRTTQTPIVAVLFDTSRSLSKSVHPDRDFGAQLRQSLSEIKRSVGDTDVDTYRFGSTVASWSPPADSIAFDGARTDIAGALEKLRDQYMGRPLRSVILVSDGRYNWGSNPMYVAERFPVPIHTVLVGDTTAYRDIRIERVAANSVGYVDREMQTRVTIHANGFEGQHVTVSLSGENISPSLRQVVLPEGESEIGVDLPMTPSSEGFHRFQASVDVLDGERTAANNRMSFSMRVLRRRMSVLFIAAGPSPDVAAVREILEGDPNLDVEVHTQKSSSQWYERTPLPQSMARFEAIILAGYPGRYADLGMLDAVAQSKKPILFLLDSTTDLLLVRDKLESVLPATVRTVRNGFVEASAVSTPFGGTHPVLRTAGDLRQLPPLSYSASRWEPTPDARILATVEVRGIPLDDPLLVVRSRAGIRSAALLGSGLWRWKNVPSDLSDLDHVFPELVSNLLQWMTTANDDRPVRVHPVEELFDGGDAVQFVGEVYDESLQPVGDASLVLSVTDLAGTTFDYRMESTGSGRYARGLGRLPEGTYQYHAVAEKDDKAIGADSGRFAVGELLLEFQDTQADSDLMRQIARRSGGAFLAAGALESLGDRLGDAQSFVAEEIEEERQYPLRRFLPLLAVIVSLLSVEWIIRKRSGMV